MARKTEKAPVDLSHTLAEAARKLVEFAETGELQARNTFGHTLGDTFQQAVLNPVAIDAILHLLEQAATRDPAYAIYYLDNFSLFASPEACEAKIFPLLDRLTTPDNLALFLKAEFGRFPSTGTLSPVERRLLDGPIGFYPDRLTPENAESFIRFARTLADKRQGCEPDYAVRCAGVLMRALTDPAITLARKFSAFNALSNSQLEEAIESVEAGFIKGPYQDFAQQVFGGHFPSNIFYNGTGRTFYKYYIMDIADGGLLAEVAQAMYHPARAFARSSDDPREEMDLLRDLATDSRKLKSVSAWAMHDYRKLHRRTDKTPVRELPPHVAFQHAFASVYDSARGLTKDTEALSLARQSAMSSFMDAYLLYDDATASDIGEDILKWIGEGRAQFAFAAPLAAQIFMRAAAFDGHTIKNLTEDGADAPRSLFHAVRAFGDTRQIVQNAIIYDLLFAQKPTAATMRGLGSMFPDMTLEQETRFYEDRFVKACTDAPELAWQAVSSLCDRAYNAIYFRERLETKENSMGLVPFLAAFVPHMHKLPPALTSEVAARMQEWKIIWDPIRLPDDLRANINTFIGSMRAPIDRSHPAFAVKL